MKKKKEKKVKKKIQFNEIKLLFNFFNIVLNLLYIYSEINTKKIKSKMCTHIHNSAYKQTV